MTWHHCDECGRWDVCDYFQNARVYLCHDCADAYESDGMLEVMEMAED